MSAVRDAAARRRGDEPGVVHHLAGRGIHKHKTRADGQPFVGLRPRADGAVADNSDGP